MGGDASEDGTAITRSPPSWFGLLPRWSARSLPRPRLRDSNMCELRSDSSSSDSEMLKKCSARSFQLVVSSHNRTSSRLRQIFSDVEPGIILDDNVQGEQNPDSEQRAAMWAERVDSYSKLMFQHTRWQMYGKSLQGYQKTLHAYTQNQLDTCMRTAISKREISSPHLGARHPVLPSPVCAQLGQLTIDEAPIPPANSPSPEHQRPQRTRMKSRNKTRSATEARAVPRHFAQSRAMSNVACG